MRERREASALLSTRPPTGPSTTARRRGRHALALLCLCALLGGLSFWTEPTLISENETRTEAVGGSNATATGEVQRRKPESRLVISLKTIPSRIERIRPTIDSLLNQTRRADEIFVCVVASPKDSGSNGSNGSNATTTDVLPEFLREYRSRGLLKFFRPSVDRGAIDKLLHVLRHEASRIGNETDGGSSGDTKILYLDDDMIYPPFLVESLSKAADRHPDSAVAFSGARLRDRFRQIRHTDPELDVHPNLYFYAGGLDAKSDKRVDIVQGFMGVVVRPRFFDVDDFVNLAAEENLPSAVRKSDDWIVSSYLESVGVDRMLVVPHDESLDNTPVMNEAASIVDALSSQGMHENAMFTAAYFKARFGIWQNRTLENVTAFDRKMMDLLYCEASWGWRGRCPDGVSRADSTGLLDGLLNVSHMHREGSAG